MAADAERDLEAIADHIATDNPARAPGFILELRDTCLSLADYPGAFPVVPRYAHLDVRPRVHGQYPIFYRVEAEWVVVLHILHDASDYLERLQLDQA